MKSNAIALSAISAALAAVLLTLGSYFTMFDLTTWTFAGIALTLPLSKKSYLGSFLAYIAASVIALLLSGANFVAIMPFIIFFGLHPIANALQLKFGINKILAFIIKLVWFLASVFVIYKFSEAFTASDKILELLGDYYVYVLLGGAALLFVVYDYFMLKVQTLIDIFIYRYFTKK